LALGPERIESEEIVAQHLPAITQLDLVRRAPRVPFRPLPLNATTLKSSQKSESCVHLRAKYS